jgi:hypothetical protein
MTAARLLETCRAAGLSLDIQGNDLFVEFDRDPPAGLIAELRQHKAELIAALAPVAPPEERAAIVEHGAAVPRAWAEGFAALSAMPPPTGFSTERWHRIVDAAGAFLDRWAAQAIAAGWSTVSIWQIAR